MPGSTHDLPPIPTRPPEGHKGTFGTVLVIGGCEFVPEQDPGAAVRMIGGTALAARAALRSGCGLVRLMMPAGVLNAALIVAPECTGVPLRTNDNGEIIPHLAAEMFDKHLESAAAVAIGPALGSGEGARSLVLRAVRQTRVPVVVDADAINLLSGVIDLPREVRAAAVVTPHPGEFARLAGPLGITSSPVDERSRSAAAESLAQKLGVVVVLKGSQTVVSNGIDTWINRQPNPALATGGSGDILTGILAGLISQYVRLPVTVQVPVPLDAGLERPSLTLFDAARLAVAVHADAAEAWVSRTNATGGMLASDLLDELPSCMERRRTRQK